MPDFNDIPPAPILRKRYTELELFPAEPDEEWEMVSCRLVDPDEPPLVPAPLERLGDVIAAKQAEIEESGAFEPVVLRMPPAVYLQLGPLRIKGAWLWGALFAFLCAAWIVGITYLGARP